MKKWRCSAECATEQYTYHKLEGPESSHRIFTLFTVFTAKRAAVYRFLQLLMVTLALHASLVKSNILKHICLDGNVY